jgi:hypothetical protein
MDGEDKYDSVKKKCLELQDILDINIDNSSQDTVKEAFNI